MWLTSLPGRPKSASDLVALAVLLAVIAAAASCTDGSPQSQPADTDARILSAYYGLDELPAGATLLCGAMVAGEDGMPVVFSVQLDEDTISPAAFAVETSSGEVVTPVCATLRPALEPLERRTVLLAGPFGNPDAPPRAVEVVGALEDAHGTSLTGLRSEDVTPLDAGPSLVLAEQYDVDVPGLAGECPNGTTQVVQLTWNGGVSGPQGAALSESQRTGVSVTLDNGEDVTPVALADDDGDNHVLACLDVTAPARRVAISAGLFHDPGDDSNPETAIDVVPGG